MTGKTKIRMMVFGFLLILILALLLLVDFLGDKNGLSGTSDASPPLINNSLFGSPTLTLVDENENKWQLKDVWVNDANKVNGTEYYLILTDGTSIDVPFDFQVTYDNFCHVKELKLIIPSGGYTETERLDISVTDPCKVKIKVNFDVISPFLKNPLNSDFSFIAFQSWRFNLICGTDSTIYSAFQLRVNLQSQYELGKLFDVDTNSIDHENKIVTLRCI